MTASDARPPSDTGTTGWHTHGGECVWPDGRCYVCDAEDLFDPPPNNPLARPVLVVDPVEARETIAVRLAVEFHEEPYFGHSTDADSCFACADILDAVLAALAGQGQP